MSEPKDKELKVTDNRMFDEHGELKEEFRHLESEAGEGPATEAAPEPARGVAPEPAPDPIIDVERPPAGSAPAESPERPPIQETGYKASTAGVQFLDLVAVVAEPIALFLGDATLPDGNSVEDLERARLYIDLLGVLREKSTGNLEPQEAAVLDDLIYRLRLRYVEKSS